MLLQKLRIKNSSIAIALVVGLSLFFIGLFLFLSIKRIIFPYEIGWMEGSIIEHAARIYSGKQLYVQPTIEFVNWLYQPFYYYVTAAIMHLTGVSYSAGRIVSFSSTLFSGGLIFLVTHKIVSDSKWHSFLAPIIYLAAFGVTGYYYDLASVDALFNLLILSSLGIIVYSQKSYAIIFSAFILALAVFTKQQAFIYIIPILVWIFLVQHSRGALLFFATVIFCFLFGTYLLVEANGNWYFFYVYSIPNAKASGFDVLRLPFVFSNFLFSFFGIGCTVIIFSCLRSHFGLKKFLGSAFGLIILMLITAAIQLTMHLGDILSYKNVAMPFTAVFAIAFTISLRNLQHSLNPRWRKFIPWVTLMQLLALLYNPRGEELIDIRDKDYRAGENFIREVTSMDGNILIASHHLIPLPRGILRHANFLAFADVMVVGDSTSRHLMKSWECSLENHSYDFIITDESVFSHGEKFRGYVFSRSCNDTEPLIYRSRVGPFTTSPRYIYVLKNR